jgi:O-acetyl-ADP-ribose deacetylase (regulator of RNase III)
MNTVLREKDCSGRLLQLVQGDITAEAVDAIVNAANAALQHGGGVAGVIARRGGPSIQRESDEWVRKHGLVSHDQPAVTGAGSLPCRYVIHAVGPIWGQGDEDRKLADAVRGALTVASALELASLSLPAISTGIFGYPKERAAPLMFSVIEAFFAARPDSSLRQVRLVLFDQPTLDVFLSAWDSSFS